MSSYCISKLMPEQVRTFLSVYLAKKKVWAMHRAKKSTLDQMSKVEKIIPVIMALWKPSGFSGQNFDKNSRNWRLILPFFQKSQLPGWTTKTWLVWWIRLAQYNSCCCLRCVRYQQMNIHTNTLIEIRIATNI